MTSSRADRVTAAANRWAAFFFIVVVAIVLLGVGPTAWAQSSAPVDLTRPPSAADQAPVAAPRKLLPPSRGEATPQQSPERPGGTAPTMPKKSGIEIDGLGNIDHETVGALDESNGGLGFDMWRGVTRTQALALLDAIPTQPHFAALRDVSTRLLLSRATAPVAVGEDVPSLLSKRAQVLLKLGDIETVRLLMSAAPLQDRPAGIDRVDAVVQLLDFNNARACGLARNNQATASADVWQRLLIYCDALDGKADGVQFGLSLLRETSGDDTAMVLLADALLSGNKITLDKIADPKPIHFAMTRAANVQLPESVAKSDDPVILTAAAMAPNLLLGAKIEAAERAVGMGVLDPNELRQLHTKVPFDAPDLENALTRAGEVGGAGARALLYQAANKTNIPVSRAEIITSALDIGREDGRYLATIEAFRPLIDRLPPTPEMVWFALTGVRAYLALGETPGTERWMALLRASAQVRDEAALALDRVRPLAHLLGVDERAVSIDEMLSAWRETVSGNAELSAAQAMLNGMFLALGEDLPANAWDGIPDMASAAQEMPGPGAWFQFRDAIRSFAGNQQATTPPMPSVNMNAYGAARGMASTSGDGPMAGIAKPVILTLQIMNNPQPSPVTIFEAVSALRVLGLNAEARRLAVETLMAAGL